MPADPSTIPASGTATNLLSEPLGVAGLRTFAAGEVRTIDFSAFPLAQRAVVWNACYRAVSKGLLSSLDIIFEVTDLATGQQATQNLGGQGTGLTVSYMPIGLGLPDTVTFTNLVPEPINIVGMRLEVGGSATLNLALLPMNQQSVVWNMLIDARDAGLISSAALTTAITEGFTGHQGTDPHGNGADVVTQFRTPEPFQLVIDTTKAGSAADTFILPLRSTFTFDFRVEWGDGSYEDVSNAHASFPDIPHVYAAQGTYTVSVTPRVPTGFPGIYFRNLGDKLKVMGLKQWGSPWSVWETMGGAFYGCSNMRLTATDSMLANTGGVSNWDTAFTGCSAITSFPHMDFSGATDITSCWNGCWSMTWIAPTLDFSNVTKSVFTWVGCSALLVMPAYDLSQSTSAQGCWQNCSSLTEFPLIDLSKNVNFLNCWNGCSKLTSFPPIDMPAGTSFTNAWLGCSSLTSFPLINVSAGQSFLSAWQNCTGLLSFPALQLTSATTVNTAWRNCAAIADFGQVVFGPNCADFTEAWRVCYGLTSFPTLDLSMGTNFTRTWFWCINMTSFPALNLSNGTNFTETWVNLDKVTAANFGLCDVSKGITFTSCFRYCELLDDYPRLNYVKLKNATLMFDSCPSLTPAKYNSFLAHLLATCTENSASFGTGSVKYSAGQPLADRTVLTSAPRSWSIVDGGSDALTLTVLTTNAGSPTNTFVLPLDPAQTYNFAVSWEPLVHETITNASPGFPNITHVFPTTGTKTVRVSEKVVSGFPKIFFNNGGDRLKLTAVTQWGLSRWLNGVAAWYGCANLVVSASDSLTAETQYATDLTDWCNGCAKITAANSFRWGSCTNFTRAYKGCTLLVTLGTSMVWTTSPLTLVSAFENCVGLSTKTLPPWNLVNLVNATDVFKGCGALASASYSAFLVNLNAVCPNSNVPFHADTTRYLPTAAIARNAMIARGWVFTDVQSLAPDQDDWEARVIANGGGVSAGTKTAVTNFITAVDAINLWPKILRLNLFCGTNFAAARTPLVVGSGLAMDASTGFVEANYTTAGLNSGSGRWLNTGLILNSPTCLGGFSIHARASYTATYDTIMGVTDGANRARFGKTGVGSVQESVWGTGATGTVASVSLSFSGLWRATRKSLTVNQIRKSGTGTVTATTSSLGASPTLPIYVFANNSNGVASDIVASGLPWGGYAIDDGSIADASESAWNTAWNNFQTAVRV